jgi:unsaturated rhamnogalacturonyl hydrolase
VSLKKLPNLIWGIAAILGMALPAVSSEFVFAQTAAPGQAPTPVNPGTIAPNYPVPYGKPTPDDITKVLTRIRDYLETSTPPRLVNRQSGQEITDLTRADRDAIIERGAFPIISYEWGVTYAGMLLAGENTGDPKFTDYAARRLRFISRLASVYRGQTAANPQARTPVRSVLAPAALDDSGSMCAAMIKAQSAGVSSELRPVIDNYIQYISTGQYRFKDGTLARNRPLPDYLWLDDLFMSVPALAQMGKLTNERRYFDDAVKQILQFSERMFVKEKGLYMHGWKESMEVHPVFLWARANGWAMMAMVELLEVLPEDHPGRAAVLDQLRAHIRGVAACQTGAGLWHQILDANDSYLETSASAIYVYSMARAMNRGWIDPLPYGPVAQLGWDAVTTKVNAQGQVEGTCVGTGMGLDAAFYYYRPTSVYASHGYGPVLLAGAEMLRLYRNFQVEVNDGTVIFTRKPSTR